MKSNDPEVNRRAGKIMRHKPTIRRSPFGPHWECIGKGVVANGADIFAAHDAWQHECMVRKVGEWRFPEGSLYRLS